MFVKGFEKSKIDFRKRATVEVVKSPFDICLDPLVMCKEGWSLGLGRRRLR